MKIADIKSIINPVLTYIYGFVTGIPLEYILPGFAVLFLLLIVLSVWANKRAKAMKHRAGIIEGILSRLQPAKRMEDNLGDILELVGSLVPANTYSFYMYDRKGDEYVLKAVRYEGTSEENIAPSYSGLLPFKKETYLPPLSIPSGTFPQKVSIVKDGAVPLLTIPVAGREGMVRLGPLSKVSSSMKKVLTELGQKLEPALDIIIEMDNLKKQVEVVVASGKAMHSISSIITDFSGMLDTVINITVKSVGASGGFFIRKTHSGYVMEALTGLDEQIGISFKTDTEAHFLLDELLNSSDFIVIRKDQKEYFQLPPSFAAAGIDLLMLIKVSSQENDGIAGFWYHGISSIEELGEHRVAALTLLAKRLGDILTSQVRLKGLSDSYTDMLKMLAQMIDNLSPYTVGYSELMSRYSAVIARELKLSKKDIDEIALAAYLSNIGILGLSNNLFLKEGKYSELEYEMMKLHSDVGAGIIEATLTNSNIASYVRYHHERIDGYGYPSGLKGDEIPLGARIISVAQTFLAKINGRKDREPLSFEKSLELIHSAAGTQLDKKAVDALINWYRKKQGNLSRQGRSLGLCWEMRCSPSNICAQCPAYKRPDINCWETGGSSCDAHGNKCDTCFIYTEYLSRSKVKALH